MKELQKKIAIELFCHPSVVVPAAFGISMLMLSAIIGSGAAVWGIAFLLLGVGLFFTNMIFNLDSIAKRTLKNIQERVKAIRDAELDKLDRLLFKTKGTRDQDILRNLRVLYDGFKSDLENGNLTTRIPPEMLQLIDDIFDTCITKLRATYALYTSAKKTTGDLHEKLMEQREEAMGEIELSMEKLSDTIHEVRLLGLKAEKAELRGLRDRLETQLEVAKATEQALATLAAPADLERFSEYE